MLHGRANPVGRGARQWGRGNRAHRSPTLRGPPECETLRIASERADGMRPRVDAGQPRREKASRAIRTHQKESVSSTKSPPVFDFANVGPPSESVGSTGLDALLQDSREAPGARGPSSLMPRHPIRSDRLVVQRPSMDGFSSKRYRRDAFATGTRRKGVGFGVVGTGADALSAQTNA